MQIVPLYINWHMRVKLPKDDLLHLNCWPKPSKAHLFALDLFAKLFQWSPAPICVDLVRREFWLAIGRYPWHGALGRFGAADREKVEEAIALVGLKPLAHRLVDSLSGGERQRAWIAMLVAQDSRCLLLDEPTSALDIAHQVDVLALVHRLSQQRGLTVIAVLHDINMAARYCDYLVALRGGEMIAQGTPAELMRSETLEQIYGIPMGILPHPAGAAPVSFVY